MPVANGFDDVPTTKSHSARSIATHPCRKRKDGAPSVRIVHARIIEGGPPAWRFTHYVMVYSQVNRSFFLFILRKPEVDDQFKVKTRIVIPLGRSSPPLFGMLSGSSMNRIHTPPMNRAEPRTAFDPSIAAVDIRSPRSDQVAYATDDLERRSSGKYRCKRKNATVEESTQAEQKFCASCDGCTSPLPHPSQFARESKAQIVSC